MPKECAMPKYVWRIRFAVLAAQLPNELTDNMSCRSFFWENQKADYEVLKLLTFLRLH
jgi:hypothetical protein